MLKNILAAIFGAIALVTFTLPAQAAFVCKPYPQFSVIGVQKEMFIRRNNPVTAGFNNIYTWKGDTLGPIMKQIISVMGNPPWPIDEIMVYEKADGSKKVLVFLYEGCVLNMALVTPQLSDLIFGRET